MTEKKSIKATLSGVGASSVSLLGICCGSGACVATCGIACATPIASIFGISTAGLSTWSTNLLPLLTAISAVAFTVAYYALYNKKEDACCDDSCSPTTGNRWAKPTFWLGLLLTLGFYANAIVKPSLDATETACCEVQTSCSIEDTMKSCKPSDCFK